MPITGRELTESPMTDRLTAGVPETIVLKILVLGLGGVVSILVSRTLGPSRLGEYTVLLTIALLTTVLGHLSVEQGQTAVWPTLSDRRSLGANAILLGLLVGSVAGTAAGLIVTTLGNRAVPVAGGGLLAVALATVPFTMISLLLGNLLMLSSRITRFNVAQLVGAVFEIVVIVVLVATHSITVSSVMVVWVLSVCLPVLLLAQGLAIRPHDLCLRVAGRTLALGMRYHLGMVFLSLLWWVDILILDAKLSSYQVGLYSVAVTLAQLTYVSTDAVAQVRLPDQSSGDLASSGRLTLRLVRLNVMVGVASLALVLVLSPVFIPLLYGSKYSASYPPLLVLAPGILAFAVTRPLGGYLIRLDRPMLVTLFTGTAMVVNVALNLVLIPPLGIAGSALASTVAYGVLAVAYLAWTLRSTGGSLGQCLPRPSDLGDLRRRLTSRVPQSTTTLVG